jgi:hydroxyacylglutathione hydrolase
MTPVVGPGVRRITCANPGPMTHTGTQSYLIACGADAVALVDPGPEDAAHREAVLLALVPGERIAAILVTHSHRDHSAGAPALAAATGAPVLAFGPHGAGMSATMRALAEAGGIGGGEGADRGFRPDRQLGDAELIEIGGRGIRALHTPGHISNHLCFALEGEGVLFTGDTAMGWSTTLVSPPDGDMAAFMETLRRLARRDDRLYLPGHGEPVKDPAGLLARQIAHREARAAQAIEALREGPGDVRALAPRIYRDIAPELLPAAERNLLATLIWLSEEGRVEALGPIRADTRFRLP